MKHIPLHPVPKNLYFALAVAVAFAVSAGILVGLRAAATLVPFAP